MKITFVKLDISAEMRYLTEAEEVGSTLSTTYIYIANNCSLLLGISRDSQWSQHITEKIIGIAGAH